MIVVFILLLFILVFVICHHFYAKRFWEQNTAAQPQHLVPATGSGLDPSLLKTIPAVVFDFEEFKDGLECAVCLSEVSEGEDIRLLSKCNHGFHLECIDMWFLSHSTCPLCRNPVANQYRSSPSSELITETIVQTPTVENSAEAPDFPASVFRGNETQVSDCGSRVEEDHLSCITAEPSSSSSMTEMSNRPEGILVIGTPIQISEGDEQKSPVPTRLGSLKRLLSGNRRINSSSPRNFDLEQGG